MTTNASQESPIMACLQLQLGAQKFVGYNHIKKADSTSFSFNIVKQSQAAVGFCYQCNISIMYTIRPSSDISCKELLSDRYEHSLIG